MKNEVKDEPVSLLTPEVGRLVRITTERAGCPRLVHEGTFVSFGKICYGSSYSEKRYIVVCRTNGILQHIPYENVTGLTHQPGKRSVAQKQRAKRTTAR